MLDVSYHLQLRDGQHYNRVYVYDDNTIFDDAFLILFFSTWKLGHDFIISCSVLLVM